MLQYTRLLFYKLAGVYLYLMKINCAYFRAAKQPGIVGNMVVSKNTKPTLKPCQAYFDINQFHLNS